MFAQKGEYDTETRLDSGPAATREGEVSSMGLLLVNGIPINSMDTCTESGGNILSSDIHAQPDSSVQYEEDSVIFETNYVKNHSEIISQDKLEYSNAEDDNDDSDSIHSLNSIEDRTDKDLFSSNNIIDDDEAQDGIVCALNDSSESAEASVEQNVSKLTQNFTLNVTSGVGNLAAIQSVVQNVSSGNQTLWLPTIIASGTTAGSEDQFFQNDLEGPPNTVSQIILTGAGQHFSTHPISSPLLTGSGTCHVQSNHKYSPKVQILSSITIPKQGVVPSISQVSAPNIKGVIHANYLTQNDLNKINSPCTMTNSVINSQLTSKGPATLTGSVRGQTVSSQSKGTSVSSSGGYQLKNTHNRVLNKLNNGNNTLSSTNQSHVLSRVVPGPKMSLQSVGRNLKTSSNFPYNQKNSGRSGLFPNMVPTSSVQSSMPVKIIQQQNVPTQNKSGLKTIPSNRTGVVSSKSWSSSSNLNQKQGSYSKNISGVVSLQKHNGKSSSQKLVLQQPSSRVIMSNSSQHNRVNSQYYQSPGEVDNTVRYIQSYLGLDNSSSAVSSNQNLTAQILQSLSQPKSLASPMSLNPPTSTSSGSSEPVISWEQNNTDESHEQWRQIQGDPKTLHMSDDILGVEERPTLTDDTLPYHYYSLQLVMLDHTYAVTQSIANNANTQNTQIINNTPPLNNTIHPSSPTTSPVKAPLLTLSSPVSCATVPSPVATLSTALPQATINSIATTNNFQYSSILPRTDDDAGSIMSSVDGDERRPAERNGSDTETAPEGEEEGKTRCVCDFTHDDGYMICCDRCGEWQHVDCMAIDRQNIPDDYMCDRCQPRLIDRKRARSIQMRKREELTGLGSSASDSSTETSNPNKNKKPANGGNIPSHRKRPLTVTTYSNTIGGVSRTLPIISPHLHQPSTYTLPPNPVPIPVNNKRGPKRPRRVDNGRKGPKRKLPEKKMRRKSEITKYRSKYCANPATSQQLNQWSESYELAMTNHYSPELRAKIARYYSNKSGTNLQSMNIVLTAHHCTTVPHAGGKILIATKDMKENIPIIELRGKYMLSTQHRPQPQPQPLGRAGSQRPGPYLFFYKFPKDSTQVCIDTRTYGNEARFVRRSCKPNAELQHCIIKGALHVYLVTISSVQSNTEISIRHESSGSWQPCACGNPKHCKQTAPTSALSHKNNGASSDVSVRERRGRTRHSSSSFSFSAVPLSAPSPMPKENISPKQLLSPKLDRRRKSEPEAINNVIMQEFEEKPVVIKKENISEPKIEIPVPVNLIPPSEISIKTESIQPFIENITKVIKNEPNPISLPVDVPKEEDLPIKSEIIPVIEECHKISECDNVEEQPVDVKVKPKIPKVMSPTPTISNNNNNTVQTPKDCEKLSVTRRTSTHSTRTTRASSSISASAAAGESADEKSDSQGDTKVQSNKDKNKMTREERKMEAIMKAFERMEKAEQRKQENKDKQTKRRESDSQPLCSVTSTSESKDVQAENSEDGCYRSNSKGRPRRRGRSRTSSQSQQKNRNRLNSVDSDMVTSEDENQSLMSPPRRSGASISETFSDTPPVTSTDEHTSFIRQTDIALEQSLQRIKVGLSSACLLVEAAVGPLEKTFKFPKTKKAIMNEWLNKSPESNTCYDIGSPLEFSSPTDNNNTSHHFSDKTPFLGEKSIENLVRAANTMIGNLSGGVVSVDSTPEKLSSSETELDNCSATGVTADSSCSPSPAQSSFSSCHHKSLKKVARDLTKDPVGFSSEKNKIPKKIRKGAKLLDPSPLKRSLRSSGIASCEMEVVESETAMEEEIQNPANHDPNPGFHSLPPPPQHSAKKRWLRQAISEESDSPTAESPPNEMVTPLKKRRLARESLSMEPSSFGHCDDAQCPTILGTPTKECSNEISFREHSALVFSSFENSLLNTKFVSEKMNCDEDNIKHEINIDVSSITSSNTSVKDNILPLLESENNSQVKSSSVEKQSNDDIKSHTVENNQEQSLQKKNDKCYENLLFERNPNTVNNIVVKSDLLTNQSEEILDFSNIKSIVGASDDNCKVIRSENVMEEEKTNDKVYDAVTEEPKSDSVSCIHSAETSGNSSPVIDEMDDIQKKIHSFHTENIQILKIRNKKQPKEKRKKVNLNFDLSVLDDQTVEVKLKSDKDGSNDGDISNTPLPESCTTENVDALESVTDTVAEVEDDSITNQHLPSIPDKSSQTQLIESLQNNNKTDHILSDININNNISSTILFSDSFRSKTYISDSPSTFDTSASIPDLNVIKNAIDMTTSLENCVFKDGNTLNSLDEYKNVEEILSRVNQMDSRNSVLLSGVLKDTNHTIIEETTPSKFLLGRSNDPRINPPPVEKPKPIRRKLSITEYRRRYSMANPSESSSSPPQASSPPPAPVQSPPTPPTPTGDDLDEDPEGLSRLEKNLEESISKLDMLSNMNIGVFNAQPTTLERQREKLSERLRREFGLSLPEDEDAHAALVADTVVSSESVSIQQEVIQNNEDRLSWRDSPQDLGERDRSDTCSIATTFSTTTNNILPMVDSSHLRLDG